MRAPVSLVWLLLGCAGTSPVEPYAECVSETSVPEDPTSVRAIPLAVELVVPNVDAGVRFYRDDLGFTVVRNDAPERSCFAEVSLGAARVLLAHSRRPFDTPDASLQLRFIVEDVDALYARVKERGLVVTRELADSEYGLREFIVLDVYGYPLRFARPIE